MIRVKNPYPVYIIREREDNLLKDALLYDCFEQAANAQLAADRKWVIDWLHQTIETNELFYNSYTAKVLADELIYEEKVRW